jgi:hypothetical protein
MQFAQNLVDLGMDLMIFFISRHVVSASLHSRLLNILVCKEIHMSGGSGSVGEMDIIYKHG